MIRKHLLKFGMVILLILIVGGCQKSAIVPEAEGEYTLEDEDIAISIAHLISEEYGGVLDQVVDVLESAGEGENQSLAKMDDSYGICTATYDSVTQTWTIEVMRERGALGDSVYAKFERTFLKQFLNKNGLPQKRYITEGDTAYSIDFEIVDGTGIIFKPHFKHHLKSISGGWLATNTHQEIVTVNGTYHRAAIDTLTGKRGIRISDHSVDLSINNVTGPRGSRLDLSQKISGSITGVFHATITIYGDNVTIIKEVERNIDIELGGDQVMIRINQHAFHASPKTGDLIDM